jgi:hypothetical protein
MGPLSPRTWLDDLLQRCRLMVPDGRPLYGYNVGDGEFSQLRMLLYGALAQTREHSALFCIYIAEWWRQNYDGGPWNWSAPLEVLGLDGNRYTELYELIEQGLRYWRRPLVMQRGARLFMVTLFCEGGLPLKLLEREGHSLTEFFRRLLDAQARVDLPREMLPSVAADLAEVTLSPRLRTDQVYELASDLVQAVVDLRAYIPETGDPIAGLDRITPGWRDRMPLTLADPIAERLFLGLARQAKTPVRASSPLRVGAELVLDGGRWLLRRRIDLPPHIPAAALQALFGGIELPAQLQLYIQIDAGAPVPLALASRYASHSAHGPRYVLERSGRPIALADADTVGLLAVAGGATFGPAPLPGGDPLTELPWVFVPATDSDGEKATYWRLHGQGSVRARSSVVLVAVGAQDPLQSPPDLQRVGELPTSVLSRSLLLMRGGSLVMALPAGSCTIAARCDTDDADNYTLTGSLLPVRCRERPVFIGLPTVEYQDIDGLGLRRRVRQGELEWRPRGCKASWSVASPLAFGEIELRHIVRGDLRWTTTVRVLPATTTLELESSSRRGMGTINLRVDAIAVKLLGPPAVEVRSEAATPGEYRWTCSADGPVADDLELTIALRDRRLLTVKVPFPGLDACFVDAAGNRLRDGARVFFGHVSGLIARLTGNQITLKSARLEAQLRVGRSRTLGDFTLTLHAREIARGRAEIQLGPLLRWSRLALASTTALDASIRVTLHDGAGGTTSIELFRYDLALERDDRQIRFKAPVSPESVAAIHLECLPFKHPTRPPERLEPVAPGCWEFSDEREAGTWLLVAREGGWCRARPMAFHVAAKLDDGVGEATPSDTLTQGLAALVALPHKVRRAAYLEFLPTLAADPAHPDWEQLYSFARTIGDLPASTFDINAMLCEFPALCARLAVEIGLRERNLFPAFWQGMEDLPFFWHLVPFAAWKTSVTFCAGRLREQLTGAGLERARADDVVHGSFEDLLQRLGGRSLAFELLANALHDALFGAANRPNDPLAVARTPMGEPLLLGRLRDEFQELLRRHSEGRWPSGSRVLDAVDRLAPGVPLWKKLLDVFPTTAAVRRPAMLAPLLTAHLCGHGQPAAPELAIELRNLQAFDPEWFDQAHAAVLTLIIA